MRRTCSGSSTRQTGEAQDLLVKGFFSFWMVQVPDCKVSTQTVITIPNMETIGTLQIGTLDPQVWDSWCWLKPFSVLGQGRWTEVPASSRISILLKGVRLLGEGGQSDGGSRATYPTWRPRGAPAV